VDMTRKIHSNAVLLNLPAKTQTAIIAHIDEGNTYVETAKWLTAENKIKTTDTMVAKFYRFHLLRQRFKTSAELSLALAEECKERGWVKTIEEQRAAAQVFFNRMALDKQDLKLWSMVERVNIVKDKVELDRKKLELQTKKFREKSGAKVVLKPNLTPEERQRRIRQILGTE
jgi:hypothetical protein